MPKAKNGSPQVKNGQQDLAGARAQLLAIQRRILEHVGKVFDWNVGWAAVLPTWDPKDELSEVNLDDDDETDEKDSSDGEQPQSGPLSTKAAVIGVSAPALREATSNINKFRQFYEVLNGRIPLLKHRLTIIRL